MNQPRLFEDPEAATALTLRVMYDGTTGTIMVASAMHRRDEPPRTLAVIHTSDIGRTGTWAVRNALVDEVHTYMTAEDARAAVLPF